MEEILDEDEERTKLKPKLGDVTHILEHITEETTLPSDIKRASRKPFVTEVEDDDDMMDQIKPKAINLRNILEDVDESKRAEPPPVSFEPSQNLRYACNASGVSKDDHLPDALPNPNTEFTLPFRDLPGPPALLKRVHVPKARITAPGSSAVGVSILSTKGRLATPCNAEIDLHLDSCADITLISEELYLSLKDRPLLQQGYQMQIFQLTETGTSIKGFIHIPVFMEATDGTMLETEAEAYVVPGMMLSILLGEDYHLAYEISVSRSVTDGSYLHFAGTPYTVPAVGVDRTNDFNRLRKGTHNTSSFVKAKTHKRAKAKRQHK